jgi:hypothetical protein
LAVKISSRLKSKGDEDHLNFFELPYYYPNFIQNILNNKEFKISPEIDLVMSKIKLPRKVKKRYQELKNKIENYNEGEEMLAINDFLEFLNYVRDTIDEERK